MNSISWIKSFPLDLWDLLPIYDFENDPITPTSLAGTSKKMYAFITKKWELYFSNLAQNHSFVHQSKYFRNVSPYQKCVALDRYLKIGTKIHEVRTLVPQNAFQTIKKLKNFSQEDR